MNEIVPIGETQKRLDVRVVQDRIAVFDTANFEHMQRIATLMATCSLVPSALQGKVADCFLVVNQARAWDMDPFAVAQCASVVKGKLCFEGKLIAAAVASDVALEGPLNYEHSGAGDGRKIVVSGKLRGELRPRTIDGTVGQWKTSNEYWLKDPDQMLAYRGARQWARRHKSDRLLGVYAPDEIDEQRPIRDVTPPPVPPAALTPPAAIAGAAVIPESAAAPAPSPPPVIEAVAGPAQEVAATPARDYDGTIADWEARLKAADRNTQEEIFEAEIEPFHESGRMFPPDYNRLMALVKDA